MDDWKQRINWYRLLAECVSGESLPPPVIVHRDENGRITGTTGGYPQSRFTRPPFEDSWMT